MVAPDPIAFSIFGIDIMWYGVLIGTGFLLAVAITYIRAPKFGIEQDFILTITIAVIPSAIIGARLYYVIFTWDMYKDDLMKIFDIRSGGLAIHGGLILSFIVAYFLCRKHGVSFLNGTDLVAPVIPLAQAIGRWGNFFNEEAHGGRYRPAVGTDNRRSGLSSYISLRICMVFPALYLPDVFFQPEKDFLRPDHLSLRHTLFGGKVLRRRSQD